MGKDVEFETPAFDLAEELMSSTKGVQSQAMTFDSEEEMDVDFGMNEDEFVPNDDTEFEESTYELSSVLDPVEELEPEEEEAPLDEAQVPDALVSYLSSNARVVNALNKGVTTSHLDAIGSAINADLVGMYESNENINMMVNAIAQGMLVGDNFDKVVASTVKMHYVPASKLDSIHLHTSAAGFQTYRSTPALKAFNQTSIDKLSALYRNQIKGFDTLYSFVKDACYKPIVADTESAKREAQAYHAVSNLDLAKGIANSTLSIDEGTARLANINFSTERTNKIAVLAKALRDNSK